MATALEKLMGSLRTQYQTDVLPQAQKGLYTAQTRRGIMDSPLALKGEQELQSKLMGDLANTEANLGYQEAQQKSTQDLQRELAQLQEAGATARQGAQLGLQEKLAKQNMDWEKAKYDKEIRLQNRANRNAKSNAIFGAGLDIAGGLGTLGLGKAFKLFE